MSNVLSLQGLTSSQPEGLAAAFNSLISWKCGNGGTKPPIVV